MGWVVRDWVLAGGEMTQALYPHMNNKKKRKSSLAKKWFRNIILNELNIFLLNLLFCSH
jgi:hypothetical protein